MFCWEQLNTTAPADALEFYRQVFDWTNEPFSAGGEMKVLKATGTSVASVMENPPGVPAHWLSYVIVDKLTSAYERVKQQGGKVMIERIDVPTVGSIGVIQDNVGAIIGVFEMPGA
jgi:predicted enzyme related to lactoylglutathione lyase